MAVVVGVGDSVGVGVATTSAHAEASSITIIGETRSNQNEFRTLHLAATSVAPGARV